MCSVKVQEHSRSVCLSVKLLFVFGLQLGPGQAGVARDYL